MNYHAIINAVIVIAASFDYQPIINAVVVMAALGLLFGLVLSIAARIFEVKTDPRVSELRSVLPGANCGACGQVGCDAFAAAVAAGNAPTDGCIPGGTAVADAVAKIMGVAESHQKERFIAVVHCKGDCHATTEKYRYVGIDSCLAAAQVYNGHKSCDFGCLGHGDCVKACPFNAIDIVHGIASIDPIACRGCKSCVAACPKHLIFMQPASKSYSVRCRNPRPAPECRSVCEVSCIGCTRCVKTCPEHAIRMEGNVAVIDPFQCVNCGACVKVCPTHAIIREEPLAQNIPLRKNA